MEKREAHLVVVWQAATVATAVEALEGALVAAYLEEAAAVAAAAQSTRLV